MDGDAVELPIFELPLVLLPGELLPLHIFEDRYKRMIARCLEDGEPFGVVFRDTDGEVTHTGIVRVPAPYNEPAKDGGARRVGCEARVTEVTERFDDGRLNIVVTGERPFKVLDRFEASEFPSGEVEPVETIGDEAEEDDTEADGATSAREAFADLVERVGGEEPDRAALDALDSYGIAARVELPPDTKQRLLELRSEGERMTILARALGTLVDTVERSHEIAERARMNGKIVVGDL